MRNCKAGPKRQLVDPSPALSYLATCTGDKVLQEKANTFQKRSSGLVTSTERLAFFGYHPCSGLGCLCETEL